MVAKIRVITETRSAAERFVKQLRTMGLHTFTCKGGIMVVLNESPVEPGAYEVPPCVEEVEETLIEATEHFNDQGQAVVICGLSGKALRGCHPLGRMEAEALFTLPGGCICVVADENGDCVITEHQIARVDHRIWIEKKDLWSGYINELPRPLYRYKPAAQAACKKATSKAASQVFYAEYIC